MNSLYIGIGVAIIMALVTALVGPYFVDWTQYRTVFEREGQRIFGENVTVLGAAQVRLLPMPSIVLNDVVVGPVDQPDLKIERLDVKIEISPLLKGDVRISELRLDHPTVRVGIDSDGKPVLPGMYSLFSGNRAGLGTVAVGLDLAEIVDGRLRLFDERSGAETVIEGLNGTASADALSGPMRIDGGARLGDHPFSFHFATGKRGDDGSWPLRLTANPTEGPYQFSAEAVLATGNTPSLKGSATLQRLALGDGKSDKFDLATTPWQIDAQVSSDVSKATLDNIQISVGAAETAYTVGGTGSIAFGLKPRFDLALNARQLDLDRLLAQKVDEPVDPVVGIGRLRGLLQGLPHLPIEGSVAFSAGGVVLGGGAVQDLDLAVRTRANGWGIDRFAARLPGRSTLALSGRLTDDTTGASAASVGNPPPAGPTFAGDVSLQSDQPPALLQWWRREPAPPIDSFSLKGHLVATRAAFRMDELDATLGTSHMRGAVAFRVPTATHGPRLALQVSADRFDLDQSRALARLVAGGIAGGSEELALTDPAGAASAAGRARSDLSPDLSLDLDAGTVIVGDQPLNGVKAKVAFDGTALTIDQLTIKDAVGASIDVKGRIDKLATTPDGAIDGSITADRLDGVVKLLETLNPGQAWPGQAWVKRLAAAAPALGKLDAKARLTGDAGVDASNVHLTLDGTAAGSRLAVEARFGGRLDRFRDGQLDASLSIEGPDGGLVLRQIGLPAQSDGVSAGKLLLSAKGKPSDNLTISASADIAGSRLSMSGKASINAASVISYEGEGQLKARDLRLPATMLGQSLPQAGLSIPLEARARIKGTGWRLTLGDINGRLVDAGIVGRGDLDLGQWPLRIDAGLQLTQADFDTLLEFGLGTDALSTPVTKGNVWPTDVLSGPLFSALTANIDLKADRLTIDPARGIDQFATKLRLRPGQVLFDDVAGTFAGGELKGALAVSAQGLGPVTISGNLALKRARLADLVWRRDERAVAEGALDLAATFDTSGRSVAALAAALSGTGAMTIRDGLLRYVDPGAFGTIIAAADGGLEIKDDKIRTVFQSKLDTGVLPFSQIEAAFAISAGVLQTNDVTVTTPLARTSGSASLDFGRWTMTGDWTLKVDPGRKGVVGAEPQVGVIFSGPLDQPKRTLDVAPLSAFLTLRAFEREVERVEDMQADIIERQRFARELKRLNEERQRTEQAQKAADAQARQKAADDARKAEEARKAEAQRQQDAQRAAEATRKAADDAAKAPAATPAMLMPTDKPMQNVPQPKAGPADNSSASPAPDAAQPVTSPPVSAPPPSAVPSPDPAKSSAAVPASVTSVPATNAVQDASPAPSPSASKAGTVEKNADKDAQAPPDPANSHAATDHSAASDQAAKPATRTDPAPLDLAPSQTQTLQGQRQRDTRPTLNRLQSMPELPPVIFIGPRPPVMPMPVPAWPAPP